MTAEELREMLSDRGIATNTSRVTKTRLRLFGYSRDRRKSCFAAGPFEVKNHPGKRSDLRSNPRLIIVSLNSFVCQVGLSIGEPNDKTGIDRLENNARLIAAACTSYATHCGSQAIECAEGDLLGELLEVCKRARSFIVDAIPSGFDSDELVKELDTIIAKATT